MKLMRLAKTIPQKMSIRQKKERATMVFRGSVYVFMFI